jgi:hypothetical protein
MNVTTLPSAVLSIRELQFGAPGRFQVFDQFRGLLLFWMILGHAYFLTGNPADFPLEFLRPGAATTSFVMLTGFVIAWIFTPQSSDRGRTRKLLRRAVYIFAVAYVSNLVFALIRDVVHGQTFLESVISNSAFQQTWTISAILVATSLTIAASAILLPCVQRIGPGSLLVGTSLAWIGLHSCRACELPPATWVDQFVNRTVFGFSLFDLTLAATWAFSLAAWLRNHRPAPRLWAAVVVVAAFGYFASRWYWMPNSFDSVIRQPAQFVFSMWLASLIGVMAPSVGAAFAVLGQHSLLVFLLHRVVLQATMIVAGSFLVGAKGTCGLVFLTTCVCWLAAYSIGPLQKSSAYQRVLRSIPGVVPVLAPR